MMFLKLGGSLITNKDIPNQAREDVIARLAHEILRFRQERPDSVLLIGHGSGSFGHTQAAHYGTQRGVHTPGDWRGFVEVWRSAHALHEIVLEHLAGEGLPALSYPPSASAVAEDGELMEMPIEPIERALKAGLLPITMGDVVVDRVRGGSIVSTEQVFSFLASPLRPHRILLAGIEPGVYHDYHAADKLLEIIEHEDDLGPGLTGARSQDVTGGMADKVRKSLSLVRSFPGMQIRIFSAEQRESLFAALMGEPLGTLIRAPGKP